MKVCTLFVAGSILAMAGSALGGQIIDLGGGWQATIESDLENGDVIADFVSIDDDILVIEKFANFDSLDASGQPVPVVISFEQIAGDDQTVSQIVITDEVVLNNSGIDFTTFLMTVSGDATFDPTASASFAAGTQLPDMAFGGGNQEVTFSGGTLESGGDPWTPGLAQGGLVINADLSGDNASFTLTEVPAPGSIALLGLAGLMPRRRRR